LGVLLPLLPVLAKIPPNVVQITFQAP